MGMPKPTEAHAMLQRLAGEWVGEENMLPSPWAPEGSRATGRRTNRIDLAGFALVTDYEQKKDGRTTFTGHGVYTYSPDERRYVLYWFDCMGGRPNLFKGSFEGDVLTLVSDESGDAGPRVSRATYDLTDPGRMKSKMEMSEDGETWKLFMEATYHRR